MLRLRIFTVLFLLAPSSLSALSIAKTRDKQDYSSSYSQTYEYRAAQVPQTRSSHTYQQATQCAVKQEQKAVAVAVAPQQTKAAAPVEVQQAPLQTQSSSPTLDTSSDSDRYVENAQQAYRIGKEIAAESKKLASLQTLQTTQSSLTEQVQLINEVIPHTTYSQENVQRDTRIALLAQYELQKKASDYKDKRNELAHAAQNPNNDNCDLLHDHLQYVKNEAHHAKTQIALQGVGSVIQENKGQIRTSRSAKGALYAHQKSSAQTIRNTRLEDHERASQLYHDLEKTRSQKAELQERLNSWRYKLNIWAEPEEELTKKMQAHEQTITAQTQQLQDFLERDLALQELVEKRQKEEDERNPFPQLPPSSPDPESPRGSQSFSLARAATVVHQASLAAGGLLLCYECYAKLKSLNIPDDHPLIKVFKALKNWLKTIYPFYKDAQKLELKDFSSLTRYAYELAYQKQQCLALQKELEELEKEYQWTKDPDLLPDHWKYIQNEEKLTAIEKGLTETHQLLEKFGATLSDAPEYKDIQEHAGNTNALVNLFHNAQREAYKNFEALQKLEEEHQRLNKAWGLSGEERQKLEKSYQDQIASLTKDFDSALRQSLIAEKFLKDQARHENIEKMLAGISLALFVANQHLQHHRPFSLSEMAVAGALLSHSANGQAMLAASPSFAGSISGALTSSIQLAAGTIASWFWTKKTYNAISQVAEKKIPQSKTESTNKKTPQEPIASTSSAPAKKPDDKNKPEENNINSVPPQTPSVSNKSNAGGIVLTNPQGVTDVYHEVPAAPGQNVIPQVLTDELGNKKEYNVLTPAIKEKTAEEKKAEQLAASAKITDLLTNHVGPGGLSRGQEKAVAANDPEAFIKARQAKIDRFAAGNTGISVDPDTLTELDREYWGTNQQGYNHRIKCLHELADMLRQYNTISAAKELERIEADLKVIENLNKPAVSNKKQGKSKGLEQNAIDGQAEGQKPPKIKIGDGETTDEADGKIKAAEQEGQEDATDENKKPTKTIDDIIKEAKPGKKTRKAEQHIKKPGIHKDVVDDLKSVGGVIVKIHENGVVEGVLPDGRTIVARPENPKQVPTLEVHPTKKGDPLIKIRYGIPKEIKSWKNAG